jgi:tetratricopeptide (TPR) repeat protein
MDENNSPPHQTSAGMLNWILGLAIALVACAIAWVGWNFIDSLQKNAGRLSKYHATAENTKVQTQNFDIVRKDVDEKIMSGQVDLEQTLVDSVFHLKGSEVTFNKGLSMIDNREFARATLNFSNVLQVIPLEAREKTSWRAFGHAIDRRLYTAFAYQERSVCSLETGNYMLAVADLTEAIKLRPDYAPNYESRAKAYNLIGNKALADADLKTARALSPQNSRQQEPLSP